MRIGVITGTVNLSRTSSSQSQSVQAYTANTDYGRFPLLQITMGEHTVFFANRHWGEGSSGSRIHLLPHQIDYRQVVQALYQANCKAIISVSATGRLSEDALPGRFVIPEDFCSTGLARIDTFAVLGLVEHPAIPQPVNSQLADCVSSAWEEKVKSHAETVYGDHDKAGLLTPGLIKGGHYRTINGPRFARPPEEEVYRSVSGAKVIGMCADPEFCLAAEAGIPYVLIAAVTDHSHYPGAPSVEHSAVLSAARNMEPVVIKLLEETIKRIPASLSPQQGIGLHSMMDVEKINIIKISAKKRPVLLHMVEKELKQV